MAESARRESPLVQCRFAQRPVPARGEAGVTLGERAFAGHFNLRGAADDPAFLSAVESALGLKLPVKPNTVASADDAVVCWLGPDEWLVRTTPEAAAATGEGLARALEGVVGSLNDVSGGQTVVVVSGRNAADTLAKGCTLDLHPSVFGPGQCAQSHLAKAVVLLRPLASNAPAYEVIVRRSFADYLWRWLEDAAAEYGLEVPLLPR